MARDNEFLVGLLNGLYQGGVGNPDVNEHRRAFEIERQQKQGELNKDAAARGLVPDIHPVMKDKGFLSQLKGTLFPGSDSPGLQTAFKPDPNLPVASVDPTGKTTLNAPGTPIPQGQFKFPGSTKDALGMMKTQMSKGGVSNVTWSTATPEQQRMAKAIYEGDVDVRTMGFRQRTDMNFLANEYANNNGLPPYKSYLTGTKEKTSNAFISGKFGQNINALNTALGHVESVHEAYQDIGNTNQEWLNVPINTLKEKTNDPKIVKLGIALNALRGELATVFKGSSGTDQDAKSWMEYLKDSLTPAQAYGAMEEVDDLLRSRQSALEYQRGSGMGQSPGLTSLISPKASKTRTSLANSPLSPKKTQSFSSIQEAESANLPKGTQITVNGRAAVIE